jgi:hypothetical protein
MRSAHVGVGEIIRDMKPRLAAIVSVLLLCSSVAFTSRNSRGAHRASFPQKSLNAPHAGSDVIVYQRVPENDSLGPTVDIYSMHADGSDDRALTHDGHSHSPSWSPDGRRILFVHDSALEKPPPYRDDGEYKKTNSPSLPFDDLRGSCYLAFHPLSECSVPMSGRLA